MMEYTDAVITDDDDDGEYDTHTMFLSAEPRETFPASSEETDSEPTSTTDNDLEGRIPVAILSEFQQPHGGALLYMVKFNARGQEEFAWLTESELGSSGRELLEVWKNRTTFTLMGSSSAPCSTGSAEWTSVDYGVGVEQTSESIVNSYTSHLWNRQEREGLEAIDEDENDTGSENPEPESDLVAVPGVELGHGTGQVETGSAATVLMLAREALVNRLYQAFYHKVQSPESLTEEEEDVH